MDVIEKLDPGGFCDYLKKYRNTICGRHPIGVLLNVSVLFICYICCDYITVKPILNNVTQTNTA